MKKLILFLALAIPAIANQAVSGFCEQGNQIVTTAGLPSTTVVQGSFPSCTVSVFTAGTTTLISIFSDNLGTALANPFTANSSGRWIFYAANNQRVDIQLSGGGLPAPWSVKDVILNDPSGGTFSPFNLNGRLYTNLQTGNDVCARITTTIGLAVAGQVVDASSDTVTLACASNIVVNKAITLLLPLATISSNTDPVISLTASGSQISCSIPLQCVVSQTTVNQNAINIVAGLSNIIIERISASATANFATETLMETNLTHGNPIYGAGTTGSHLTNIIIRDSQFNNGNNSVILVYADRSAILQNRFDTPAQTNPGLTEVFLVGNGSLNRVEHNTFNDTLGIANAVYIRGNAVANESPSQDAVVGNTINGIYQFEAINLDASFSAVSGNTIKNSSNATNAAGIALFEPANGAQADTLSTCNFNSVTGNTIDMLGSAHNEAIVEVDNGSTGDLGCNDNVISSNTIFAISGHGIGVGANNLGGVHIGGYRNSVTGNKVTVQQNGKDGINLFTSNDTTVTGNHLFTSAGVPGNGVNLAGSLRTTVTGNYVIGFNSGILTNGSATFNAVLCGNFFRNVGNAIALNSGTVGVSPCSNRYDGVTTIYQLNNSPFSIGQDNACTTLQKTETAADTNVLTCVPAALAGSYRIRFALSLSAANAATLGWTVTWTDSNGNAQTPANLALFQSATAAPALTFTTSVAGNYYGYIDIDVNNAGASIIVKLTFSGTSFAGKASATVERII